MLVVEFDPALQVRFVSEDGIILTSADRESIIGCAEQSPGPHVLVPLRDVQAGLPRIDAQRMLEVFAFPRRRTRGFDLFRC